MADTFKKAREMSRLARRQTDNGSEQEEKERLPFASKRVVEGGENDENFIRATAKRPLEDGLVEESGIRPPSKRLPPEEFEERNVSRWELAKLQASLKQAQEASERWRLETEQYRSQLETQTAAHARQVALLESQSKSHSTVKPTPPKADFSALHDLRSELGEKKRLLSASQQEIEELRANERKLQHENDFLAEKNAGLESQHRTLQQEAEELQTRMSHTRVEKTSVQEYKNLLDETLQKCKDLESQLASKPVDKMVEKVTQDMSLALREKEREIRHLTTENQRMRAKVKACETAEDELAELRSKEARNEKMREELAQVQSEVLLLKEKEDDWVSSLCHVMPGKETGPREILRLIESLQNSCQLQKAEHGQVVALNKQLELRLQHQQERCATFEAKAKEGEAALEQAHISIERGRVELSRAVKDKEMYKGFLDSYEAEDKTVKHDEARGQRIEELEKSLLAAQTRANEKETTSQVLEMKNRQLEQHLQQVEAEAVKMSEALGRGEFNPQNTKVLHMALNPAKKAVEAKTQAQIEQLTKHCDELKVENDALKRRLTEGSSGPVVIQNQRDTADIAEKEKEIVKLKKTVADLETSKDRFYQVFREKVKQFRESCYVLTGFKIEMKQISGHNGFVLRSMYAENEEDVLEFYDTGTKLQVMETDYCKRLDKQILDVLGKANSIPVFLSEVTLDLFSKQTRM